MAALHIMLVLCHDFGAKRAFLLKAAGPAKLLIYFQDFRSFSSPRIRRFLTDLGASPLPQPHFLLSSTLSTLPPSTSHTHSCFLTLVVLASAVCQLEPFQFLAHLHSQAHTHTHTHAYTYADIFFEYSTHTVTCWLRFVCGVMRTTGYGH